MSRMFFSPRKTLRPLTLALAFASALLVAAPLGSAEPASPPPDPVVLTVDGEPVSAAEYRLVMNGRVSEVFTYFHAKDGREDRLGYWKDDGLAENPIRKLHELTTAEFREIKTIQALAKKAGAVSDISYAAFKEGLAKENARRARALENREVIYGPTRYKEHRYYHFQLADLKQAALESFFKDPANSVTAADIDAFYSANQEHFKETPLNEVRDRIARILQKKTFEKRLAETAARARVEISAEALAAIAPRHDP